MGTRSVDQLIIGESAVIHSLEESHPSYLKLLDLGFTPGQEIQLLNRSPFRDPIALSLRGTIFALRRKDALCIKI
ncbi:MAG: ferrous iron transport protein A [Bacteroidetes bacterium]|nr:ferrous iron transport protein A [Bacteroidota bacterium]